jgi:phenylacetate-CoA ligase
MEVHVEVTPAVSSDKVGALEKLHNKLAQSLHQMLGLRVEVRLVAPQTLKRSEGKAQRLIDRRNLDQ